jgi:hypothetical protein
MEKSIEDVCIQVAARIRPCPDLSEDQHCVQLDKDNQSIWLQDGINVKKEYEFDCVLDASATQVVFLLIKNIRKQIRLLYFRTKSLKKSQKTP